MLRCAMMSRGMVISHIFILALVNEGSKQVCVYARVVPDVHKEGIRIDEHERSSTRAVAILEH